MAKRKIFLSDTERAKRLKETISYFETNPEMSPKVISDYKEQLAEVEKRIQQDKDYLRSRLVASQQAIQRGVISNEQVIY